MEAAMATPHQDTRAGHPFGDDYRQHRSAQQVADDRAEVCEQVANLIRRRTDEAFRRRYFATLQRRRRDRDDLDQFQVVRVAGSPETLVVRDQLLMRAELADDPMIRDLLRGYRLQRDDTLGCEELEDRVVRYRGGDTDARGLNDVASLLRRRHGPATVNHLVPLGPVGKGMAGPKPADGLPPFPPPAPARKEPTSPRTVVAIVDTGIDERMRGDDWLASVHRHDGNIDPLDVLPRVDGRDGDGYLDLGAGHGTFAAGIVQQVAPEAEIRMYKALDSDGVGSDLAVACAMIRAVKDGAQVLSLSLGTQTLDDRPPLGMENALQVIRRLEREREQDVVIVAAAGNSASTRPCWPAAFRRVVSVAGLTADLKPSDWSNHGFWVDCSTVAEGVLSTYVEGREALELDLDPDVFPPDAWARWSGTSFAAPQVAGAIARLSMEGLPNPRDALRELLRRGRPVPDFGRALEILPGV
jgi:subtilisin family serine protease